MELREDQVQSISPNKGNLCYLFPECYDSISFSSMEIDKAKTSVLFMNEESKSLKVTHQKQGQSLLPPGVMNGSTLAPS